MEKKKTISRIEEQLHNLRIDLYEQDQNRERLGL